MTIHYFKAEAATQSIDISHCCNSSSADAVQVHRVEYKAAFGRRSKACPAGRVDHALQLFVGDDGDLSCLVCFGLNSLLVEIHHLVTHQTGPMNCKGNGQPMFDMKIMANVETST